MSKIIKASHLLVVRNEHPGEKTEIFTPDKMETLYQEARAMVEELINDAKVKAESILTQARKEADLILQTTYQEAERLRTKAYNDGFNEGKEAGLLNVNNLINDANEIVKKAYAEREEILARVEPEIVDFSIKLAEKIIRTELNNKPEIIKNITKDLLVMVQDAEQITLKIHADDFNYLNQNITELQSFINQGKLKLEQDSSLSKGDCILVSEMGIIVAKITDQLERLKGILTGVNSGG
ncbi:MAG: flagellar assembly protein FliH [Clostridia bacterium]|nr:flagellar assembly protein FliH [Clostridia bacterium]MDN5322929.1 flagellar assembly protein FliH [Clostridia bacterium]